MSTFIPIGQAFQAAGLARSDGMSSFGGSIGLGLELERRGLPVPTPLAGLMGEMRRRGMLAQPVSIPGSEAQHGLFVQRWQKQAQSYVAPTEVERQAYVDQGMADYTKSLQTAYLNSAGYQQQAARLGLGGVVDSFLHIGGPGDMTEGQAEAFDMNHDPGVMAGRRDQFGKEFDALHGRMAYFVKQRQEAADQIAAAVRDQVPGISEQEVGRHVQQQLARLGYTPEFAGELPAAIDSAAQLEKLDAIRTASLGWVDKSPSFLQPVAAAGLGVVKSFDDTLATLGGTVVLGGLANVMEKLGQGDAAERIRQDQRAVEYAWGTSSEQGSMRASERTDWLGSVNRGSQALGSMAGDLAQMMVVGAAGGGAAKAAQMTARFQRLASVAGASGFMGTKSGAGLYRGVRDSLIAQGVDVADAESRAQRVGLATGLVMGLINVVPAEHFLFANPEATSRLQGALRGMVVNGGVNASMDFISAAAQFEAGAGGKELFNWDLVERMAESAAIGGIVGGTFGAAQSGEGLMAARYREAIAQAVKDAKSAREILGKANLPDGLTQLPIEPETARVEPVKPETAPSAEALQTGKSIPAGREGGLIGQVEANPTSETTQTQSETTAPVPETTKPAGKEPWQMTKTEFEAQANGERAASDALSKVTEQQGADEAAGVSGTEAPAHARDVEKALAEGKLSPEQARSLGHFDAYPELAARYEQAYQGGETSKPQASDETIHQAGKEVAVKIDQTLQGDASTAPTSTEPAHGTGNEGSVDTTKPSREQWLKERYAKEYSQNRIDPLTGLGNRRLQEEQLARARAQADHRGKPFSIFTIDLNNFKFINDTKGHGVGDSILKQFGDFLRKSLRTKNSAPQADASTKANARQFDTVGVITRGGGDEFMVILPNTSLAQAVHVRQRLEEAFGSHVIDPASPRRLRMVVGIGEYTPKSGKSLESVMEVADFDMYTRKREQKIAAGEPTARHGEPVREAAATLDTSTQSGQTVGREESGVPRGPETSQAAAAGKSEPVQAKPVAPTSHGVQAGARVNPEPRAAQGSGEGGPQPLPEGSVRLNSKGKPEQATKVFSKSSIIASINEAESFYEHTVTDKILQQTGDYETNLVDVNPDAFNRPFSFPGKIPTELLIHFEGEGERLQLHKFVENNVVGAQGEDYAAALGERFNTDGWAVMAAMIRENMASVANGEKAAKFLMGMSMDRPQESFLANILDSMPKKASERAPQDVVDPRALPDGALWEINGKEARITSDADGLRLLEFNGRIFPLDAIERAPVDRGTYAVMDDSYRAKLDRGEAVDGEELPFMPADGRSKEKPHQVLAGKAKEPTPGLEGYLTDTSPTEGSKARHAKAAKDRPAHVEASIAEARARRDGKIDADHLDNIYTIIRDLSRRLDASFAGIGKNKAFRDRALGFWRPVVRAIRMKSGSDITTYFHELGHDLHSTLFAHKKPTKMGISADDFPNVWRKELVLLGHDLYGNTKPAAGYAAEGWAETIRHLLIDPAHLKKRAPTVYRDVVTMLVKNRPEVYAALLDARVRYLNASAFVADNPVRQYVARDTRKLFTWTNFVDDLKTRWTNRYQRLETMTRDLRVKMPEHKDPMTMALRSNGHISGDLHLMIERGIFDPADPSKKPIGPSLKSIVAPIMSGDNWHLFEEYMIARRTIEKRQQGFHVLPQDGRLPDHTTNLELSKFINRVEKLHPEFGDFFKQRPESIDTSHGSAQQIEDPNTVAARFQKFNEWIIKDYAIHYGLLSKASANMIVDKNLHYITFRYVTGDSAIGPSGGISTAGGGGFTGQGSGIHRFGNSKGMQIAPPMNSFLDQLHGIVARARLNEVGVSVTKLFDAQIPGAGRWLDKIDRPVEAMRVNAGDLRKMVFEQMGIGMTRTGDAILPQGLEGMTDTQIGTLMDALTGIQAETFWKHSSKTNRQAREVTVMRNGEPVYYEIKDQRLFDVLEGLNNPATTNLMVRTLSIPGRVLKAGATQYNPSFFIPNFTKDLFHALTVTDTELRNLPEQTRLRLAGMKEAFVGGKYHDLFLASGADMAGIFGEYYDPRKGFDFSKLQEETHLYGLVKGENWKSILTDAATLGQIDRLNRTFELANRLGEFAVSYEQNSGLTEAHRIARAGQAAAEATLDFSRGGTWAKQINEIVPFFNAAILGTDRLARFIKQNPLRSAARISSMIVAPSIASMVLNYDNEDYWAKPKQMRDRYWYFPTGRDSLGHHTYLRLQKPPGLAAFSIATERSFTRLWGIDPETGKRGDTRAMEGMGVAVLNELRPTINIAGIQPLLEVNAGEQGYSFFMNKSIVSEGDKDLPYADQGAQHSSDLARFLGRMMDYSPAKIDYLVNGYFGGLGKDMVQIGIDPLVRALDPKAKESRPIEFKDYLIVRRFIAGQTRADHEAISRFYDDYEALDRIHKGYLSRKDDPEEQRRYKQDHVGELMAYEAYAQSQAKMRELFRGLRSVYASDQFRESPEAMDAHVQRVIDQIVRVAQNARDRRVRQEEGD